MPGAFNLCAFRYIQQLRSQTPHIKAATTASQSEPDARVRGLWSEKALAKVQTQSGWMEAVDASHFRRCACDVGQPEGGNGRLTSPLASNPPGIGPQF